MIEFERDERTTAQVLTEMWTENTGAHFLDSGGAYGRNWERNAGKTVEDMKEEPAVTLDVSYGYLDITVNAWHFLEGTVDYDPLEQRRFELYSHGSNEPWLVDLEAFASARHDRSWTHDDIRVVNTYNHDSWLGDVLQYVVYTSEEGITYAGIQYHGGCDVRGGYTKPRFFQIDEEYALYTEGYVSLSCSKAWGQDTGQLTIDGKPARAAIHSWDSQSSGIEWSDYEGSFDVPMNEHGWSPEVDDNGDMVCPIDGCDGKISVYVDFGM